MKKNFLLLTIYASLACIFGVGCNNDDIEDSELSQDEKVITEIDKVAAKVSPFFLQCDNAAEMATYLDEINALEQVEMTWVEDDAIYAKLDNGFTVFWYFPPKEEELEYTRVQNLLGEKSFLKNITKSRATFGSEPVLMSDTKICLICQYVEEAEMEELHLNETLKDDAEVLRNWGFQVREVYGNEFSVSFLKDSLANYNVVLLCTHGMYSKPNWFEKHILSDQGLHWILTGQEIHKGTKVDLNGNEDYMMVGYVKYGESTSRGFLAVSEMWLEENIGCFPNNSFMYSTACSSLKENESLYNVLKYKNLGSYLGFNGTTNRVFAIKQSMDMFISLMLMGSTVKGAYDLLGDRYTLQKNSAKLLLCQRDDNEICMYDAIDMGLDVKWGARNLGAPSPFMLGNFYQWGVTESSWYDKVTYPYWETGEPKAMTFLEDDISGTKYDAATALLGKHWRMPTRQDFKDLLDVSVAIWCDIDTMVYAEQWVSGTWCGVLLQSTKTHAVLFFPFYWNSQGAYWTSTLVPEDKRLYEKQIKYYEAYAVEMQDSKKYYDVLNTGDKITPYSQRLRRVWLSCIRPVYIP